ncbi:MAG: hypothetical protein GXO75_21415 [Calditrichaeota bacterium]|nr:hypothetical protein [Calditrichota bacterium]
MKDKYSAEISLYIDDQCTPARAAEIRQHLQSCDKCRKQYHEFLALKKNAKRLKSFSVSPFFADRIVAMAKRRKQESFWSALEIIPRPLLNAAFILSVVIIVVVAMPRQSATTANDSASNIIESSLVSENDWPHQSLETNDEALQFALDESEEATGEIK